MENQCHDRRRGRLSCGGSPVTAVSFMTSSGKRVRFRAKGYTYVKTYKKSSGTFVGGHWRKGSYKGTTTFTKNHSQVYYKIVNSKLYISLNKEVSWSPTNDNGLPNNFQIRYFTIDHTDANIIFLFSIQFGVYESKDAGYSWNPINNGLFGNFDLSYFPL